MKRMKKVFALLMTLVMVLGMGSVAFAETITIDGAVSGKTYTAYKLLDATYEGTDVELDDDTSIAYYYSGAATDELYTILAKYFQFDDFVGGKAYLKVVDDNGTAIDYSSVDVAALAAEINTAMTRSSSPLTLTVAGSVTASGTTAEITGLAKGYYFVDTSTGSICSIDTAGKVTMYEKNSVPSVTGKLVKKEGEADYAASAEGTVGDLFQFKVTANTGTNSHAPGDAAGYDNDFVITDILGKGFTLDSPITGGFQVKVGNTSWTQGNDFTVTKAANTDGTTTITITLLGTGKLKDCDQDTDIDIYYAAELNENAITDGSASNNANDKTTTVYTYDFDLLKTNTAGAPLENVTFTLTNEAGTEYYIVPSNADSVDEDVMRALAEGEDGIIATNSDGKIEFKGLGSGTYTLTEIATLDGYNKLDAPITITITPDAQDPSTATVAVTSGDGTVSGTVVTVVNKSGTVLPSTGGIGTTMFYVVGSILVIGAAVLLISRRRMNDR